MDIMTLYKKKCFPVKRILKKMKCLYVIIAGVLSFTSCEPVTPFDFYGENIFRGKELMKKGEFEEARAFFCESV
jgi:hypothetical protein